MVLTANGVYNRIKKSAHLGFEKGLYRLRFQAMATACHVNFAADSAAAARYCGDEIISWVAGFEARYSRFIPDSLISRINEKAGQGWVTISEDDERIFAICQEMHFFTRGIFDPTSLPLIRLWNWKAANPTMPDDTAIEQARERVGWRKVQRKPGVVFLPHPGMSLDLGGIGKEYAVDYVAHLAKRHGIENVMVDFGQDIQALGSPPGKPAWHIGLEDAQQPGRCWTGLAITNQAVASSGDYQRYFIHDGQRYSHVIDPRTGRPVCNDCRVVTVVAPSCVMAGILSTSAFVLGSQEGLALIEAYYRAEGSITTDRIRSGTQNFDEYVVS